MNDLTGRCFCGAVQWTAMPPILWAALCHCEDCRKVASSDYVSWFGVERHTVTWSGPRKTFNSSPLVERSFCEVCGSPLSFETSVFENETHLYAVTLDIPEIYRPTAHIFWSERVAWMTESEGLPTHEKGLQDAAQQGQSLLKPKM